MKYNIGFPLSVMQEDWEYVLKRVEYAPGIASYFYFCKENGEIMRLRAWCGSEMEEEVFKELNVDPYGDLVVNKYP